MLGEKFGHFCLNRLRQQGARSVAQHLGERVSKRPWLKQLDHGSIRHGVSLLCWISGGSDTPRYAAFFPSGRLQLLRIARWQWHPEKIERKGEGMARVLV